MTIRSAIVDDAPAVADLIVQLGYSATVAEAADRLERLLARPDNDILVAVDDDRVVGFLHVSVSESIEGETTGEIRGLVVNEAHRSGGIGAQLVEAAEAWVRQQGVRKIRVRSNVKRERARRFYERHGYIVVKTSNIFDKEL